MPRIDLSLDQGESIAFVGDIHVDSRSPQSRIDDILLTLDMKLKDMLNKCKDRNVKYVFLEGDVVNRVGITYEAMNLMASIFISFRGAGIELFTILGNHDIIRNSLEQLDKSPVQTLFSFGVLRHLSLDSPVWINGGKITAVDYTEYPEPADKSAKFNILLAHMFYNASELVADERHNLTPEAVKSLGYDMIFTGHDHELYPILTVDGTVIVRTGSILRGTSHNYNFTRIPQFAVLHDLSKLSAKDVEIVELKCHPYEEVASEYVINKKQLGTLSGLQDALAGLAEKLQMTQEMDGDRIFEIIKSDPELPSDCRDLLLKYISETVV